MYKILTKQNESQTKTSKTIEFLRIGEGEFKNYRVKLGDAEYGDVFRALGQHFYLNSLHDAVVDRDALHGAMVLNHDGNLIGTIEGFTTATALGFDFAVMKVRPLPSVTGIF
jgi:hypothetical protein